MIDPAARSRPPGHGTAGSPALNYTVSREAIVCDVLKGTGAVSRGPGLPDTWGADPTLKAYPSGSPTCRPWEMRAK